MIVERLPFWFQPEQNEPVLALGCPTGPAFVFPRFPAEEGWVWESVAASCCLCLRVTSFDRLQDGQVVERMSHRTFILHGGLGWEIRETYLLKNDGQVNDLAVALGVRLRRLTLKEARDDPFRAERMARAAAAFVTAQALKGVQS